MSDTYMQVVDEIVGAFHNGDISDDEFRVEMRTLRDMFLQEAREDGQ